MLDKLDSNQWIDAAEACILLGRVRDYARLSWLWRKGKIKHRLEPSERKRLYLRSEIVALAKADSKQRKATESYSAGPRCAG